MIQLDSDNIRLVLILLNGILNLATLLYLNHVHQDIHGHPTSHSSGGAPA